MSFLDGLPSRFFRIFESDDDWSARLCHFVEEGNIGVGEPDTTMGFLVPICYITAMEEYSLRIFSGHAIDMHCIEHRGVEFSGLAE